MYQTIVFVFATRNQNSLQVKVLHNNTLPISNSVQRGKYPHRLSDREGGVLSALRKSSGHPWPMSIFMHLSTKIAANFHISRENAWYYIYVQVVHKYSTFFLQVYLPAGHPRARGKHWEVWPARGAEHGGAAAPRAGPARSAGCRGTGGGSSCRLDPGPTSRGTGVQDIDIYMQTNVLSPSCADNTYILAYLS